MKTYNLEFEQFIDLPIEDVFNFFSKPENLSLITPPRLRFDILTPTPLEMKEGQLIDYSLTIMYFIKLHWRTLITKYDPPHEFIDEQMKGPYNFWHHTHKFKKVDGGVEISDKVIYSIPMGIIGRFLHFLWIKRDLEKIFSHRKKVINDLLVNNISNTKNGFERENR